MTETSRYIGDGVYAKYDGFGIELRANDPESEFVIYLELHVINSLNMFVREVLECNKD